MEDGSTSNANESRNEPVTITTGNGEPPSVTIDPQNPLPEPSFFWRRVIAMAVATFACVLAWWTAEWLYDLKAAQALLDLTKLVIYGAGLILTYYFIAPSASELTNMVQSANIIKRSLAAATEAKKDTNAANAAYGQRKFESDPAPDSGYSPEAPGEAYRPPSDDLTNEVQDAAPTSRK